MATAAVCPASSTRTIAGFFSPDDLERYRFIRERKRPLKDTSIDNRIVERPYQHEESARVRGV
jgi:type I site-specific restriction endonuclease